MILCHSLPVSLCDSNYLKGTYKFSTEVLYYVISGQSKYTTISIVPCIRKFSNDLIFAFFAMTFTLQNIRYVEIHYFLQIITYYITKNYCQTQVKKKRVFPFFVNFVTCNKSPDIWHLI